MTHSTAPPALHLGDLVNVVQFFHRESLDNQDHYVVQADTDCPCCGANTGDTVDFLLGLLDTRLVFGRGGGAARAVRPMWFKGGHADRRPYVKAKKLPIRGNGIVCQFDGRSRGEKRPPDQAVARFLAAFPGAVNVGDNKLACVNRVRSGLQEKFDLIASAGVYVGIDSGLTHLALMTETPVLLFHPPSWDARRFYPRTRQVTYVASAPGLIKLTKEIVNGLL